MNTRIREAFESTAAVFRSTPSQTRSSHEYVSLWIGRKNQPKEKKS
jgi:hypothetical protein